MKAFSNHSKCPCGRGRKYGQCCGRWHDGEAAPNPEALMRARYCAFALGRVEYLMETTHPSSPHIRADPVSWAGELKAFCETHVFQKLKIVSKTVENDRGTVHFRARFKGSGKSAVLEEDSLFLKIDGRWFYHAEVEPKN